MVLIRTMAMLLVAGTLLGGCRKKKSQSDDSGDISGALGDVLVVSGNQPVRGDATVVVSTDESGQTSVVLSGTGTSGPTSWKSLIKDFSTAEDQPLAKTVVATELTGTVRFELVPASTTCDDLNWNPNVAVDAVSGALTGTPSNADVGACTLSLKATGTNGSLTGQVTVTVTNTNDSPYFTQTVGDFVLSEGQAIAGKSFAAVDDDQGQTPVFSIDAASSTCDDGAWAPAFAIDPSSGVLSGAPTASDVGSCNAVIRVTTAGESVSAPAFTVVVSDVPMPPTWIALIGNRSLSEDADLSTLGLAAQALDTDAGQTPTYALDFGNMTCDNGAWNPAVAVNSVTGALSGKPVNADVGSCTIKIDATSNGETISQSFTLTVTNVDDALTWDQTIGDFDWTYDQSLAGTFAQATDVDAGSAISYTLDTANMTCDDAPGQWSVALTIDSGTGELSGTPNATGGLPRTCSIRIGATSDGVSIFQSFDLTVVNTSTPPTWTTTIGNRTLAEDADISTLSLVAQASDVDAGQTPTYSFNAGAMTCDNGFFSPALAINPTTGALSAGTPTNGDVGTCTVAIRATSAGDTIQQSFTLTVTNTNDLPVWDSTIADFSIAQGASITKTADASDQDPGATITYALDAANMTCDNHSWTVAPAVDPSTGALTGTPSFNNANACTIRVTATSGADVLAQTINVTVTDTTAPNAPGSMTNLRYTTANSQSPTLTWAASSSSDVSHYLVSLGTSAGGTQVVNESNVGATLNTTLTGLTLSECQRYYPSVKAADAVPNKSVATLSNNYFVYDNTAPSAPTNLKLQGTPTATSTPTLSWQAPADNCGETLAYEVAVGSATGIPNDVVDWVNVGSVTSYKFTNISLTVNEDYIMTVRSVDYGGNKSVTTESAQFLPINLAAMIAWLDGADHSSIKDDLGRDADNASFNGKVASWLDVSGNVNRHDFSATSTGIPTFNSTDDHVVYDGVDDYLTTPNHVEINTGTVDQRNITVAFKTSASDVTARQVVYEEGAQVRGMNFYIQGGKLYCGFWNTADDGDGAQPFASVNADITTDTRYFVTWVFDYTNYTGPTGPDGTLTCYLNGATVGSIPTTSKLYAHTGAVGLGKKVGTTYYHDGPSTGDGDPFKGRILELMLFRDAPSAATVISTHNYLNNKWDPLAQ